MVRTMLHFPRELVARQALKHTPQTGAKYMLTQAQAQKHADACGCKGIALPIPLPRRESMGYVRLADDVLNPENCNVLFYAGETVTDHTLALLSHCYGLDYVTVVKG